LILFHKEDDEVQKKQALPRNRKQQKNLVTCLVFEKKVRGKKYLTMTTMTLEKME